ncbi:MAG: cytochrome ubiquinol oxidase subunit I, partial [Paracoccaceae bacterium]
ALVLAALGGSLLVALACGLVMLRAPTPDAHAYGATLLVLGGYGLFHALLAALMAGMLALRIARGYTSPVRRAVFPVVGLWIDYLALVGPLVLLAAHLSGMAA